MTLVFIVFLAPGMAVSESIAVESDLIFAGFLVFLGAFYLCVVWFRRMRFRRLAAALDGSFMKMGLVRCKVVGPDFSIEPRRVGRGYRTFVNGSVNEAPGTYLLKTPFFDRFPDWDHAMVLGMKSERLFVAQIAYPRYAALTLQQQQELLRRLAHASFNPSKIYDALRASRVDAIVMDPRSISVSFPGIVSSTRRLGDVLTAFRIFPRAAANATTARHS